MLHSANGILFTGGGLSLEPTSAFYRTGAYIFKQVQVINTQGVHLPLHGTCMGFQFLSILAAGGNTSVLQSGFDSEFLSLPLQLTSLAASSRVFGGAPQRVMRILSTQNVTSNLHHSGVTPETFETNALLKDFFGVLSVNSGRKGRTFVSTIEAHNFPIRGTQWHPERPQFEWNPELNLNHSGDAILAMQYMANFFVSESRKNSQSFMDSALGQRLLQRYITFNMTTIPMSPNHLSGYFAVIYS
jgi:gamma-glutamyl hydrolase